MILSRRDKEVTAEILALLNEAADGEWVDCRGHHYKMVQVVIGTGSGVIVDLQISNDLVTPSAPTDAGATGINASKILEIDDACIGLRARVRVVSTGTITGASKTDPVTITSAGHGLTNGTRVRIIGVVGMTELNGNIYTVANAQAGTFDLSGVNGTGYGTYISGGTWQRQPVGRVSVYLHGIMES